MKPITRLRLQRRALTIWNTGVLIFVVALVIRLAFIVAAHPYRDLSRYELERTAISLSRTGVFGNPYAISTGPTAHVSPGYTLILAAVFHLFGEGTTAEIIKEVISATVTSLGFAFLPFAADRIFNKASIGLFAGLICGLLPWKPMVQIDGDWETPYTALFLTSLVPITIELWKRKSFTMRKAVGHGLFWGVGLLFASVLLPLLPVLTAIGFWFLRRTDTSRYARFVLVEVVVVAACLTPWILRNERALGAPIATRSNLGLELRVSNNDDATADQRANLLRGVYDKYHPLQNAEEAKRVRQLGEVNYNKWANAQAMDWIHSHPKRFLTLTFRPNGGLLVLSRSFKTEGSNWRSYRDLRLRRIDPGMAKRQNKRGSANQRIAGLLCPVLPHPRRRSPEIPGGFAPCAVKRGRSEQLFPSTEDRPKAGVITQ